MKRVVLYKITKEQRGDKIVKSRMIAESVTVEDDTARAVVHKFTEAADFANLQLKCAGSRDYAEVLVLEEDGTEV